MITADIHSRPRAWLWWGLAIGLGIFQASGDAHAAADKRCHQRAKAKQTKAAAECFETLARSLGPAKALEKKRKYAKGQWLRNAAILWRRAAKQTPTDATKLRIRAVGLLDLYLREALCETRPRCLSTRSLRDAIHQEIGYALIAILTGDPKASFVLRGVGLTRRGSGARWEGKLPPGSYLVTVSYPSGKSLVKALKVKRLEAQVVQVSPPAKLPPARRPADRQPPAARAGRPPPRLALRRTPPRREPTTPVTSRPRRTIWPWIVVGIGGAVLVGGVVALAAGKGLEGSAQSEIATLRQGSTPATAADTNRLLSQFDAADASIVAGWSLLGVGVATAAIGVVGAILNARPAATPDDAEPYGETGISP